MTQKTADKPTPVFHTVLADPEVPFPELTGGEPCRQTDSESWFPEQGDNGGFARSLCLTSCPVLQECRSWALANPQLASDGIWGGMTRSERNAVRRRQALQSLEAAA
ncbi:WhiB family transcriptional regulator [Streptomyces sp. RLB3-6]|uniref:WhiB family transcriptional regulator n=1 Tax=Streptomyces sp. RLB3-6 TaxID=2594457 RepID=UPI00116314B6|nr:WhiB family transcriptional regulator [Streptomyces sp. RLB3-6]QDN84363.1 WhiB family transcriptional regulator [Streptomyces sp. RLB3-6]